MVPKLELNDVGFARQGCNVIKIICNYDISPDRSDLVDKPVVTRRLEQYKSLLNYFGQNRGDGCVRLPTPPPKCGVTCKIFIQPPPR